MSNQSFLLAGTNNAEAPFENEDSDDEVLRSGRYLVPVLWLTGFRASDIIDAGDSECFLSAKIAEVRTRSRSGFANLVARISIGPGYLDEWLSTLDRVRSPYLKVELQEVLDMDDTSARQLARALFFFDEPTDASWNIIYRLCDVNSVERRLNGEQDEFLPSLDELFLGLAAKG